ncbi:MAG: radical SAM protein [Candidatus Aenigmatarchaeota archaeon]
MIHLDETVSRIKNWFKNRKEDPVKVDIFFTEACNFKCKFCNYSKIGKGRKEISDEEILKLVDEICGMNVKIFGVLGGEPFLRKKVLLKSMEKVKKHGIKGSIVTNGSLLEERDIKKIVKIEWDLIRLSVDGLKNTHEYLRGVKNSFDKVLNVIKNFHKIKKKFNSNFPTVEVNFVLTNKNYRELSRLIEILSPYEINFIYVLPMIELTEEAKTLKITEEEISEVNKSLRGAKKICEKYGIGNNLKDLIEKNLYLYSNKMDVILEKGKSPVCFLPWYSMNINSDGSVTPCAQWPREDGAKLNGKSLKKVWYEEFGRMRVEISKRLLEWCSRCCVPLVDENKAIREKIM